MEGSIEKLTNEINKWLEAINKAIDDGYKILFSTSKSDYTIVSINQETMKASAIRKKDDKPGTVNLTSYDFENFYKKLPRKYKKHGDVVQTEKKKSTKKLENNLPKKIPVGAEIRDFIKLNPNCSLEKIQEHLDLKKLLLTIPLKSYLSSMKKYGEETKKYNIIIDNNLYQIN